MNGRVPGRGGPLDRVRSIKVKLGLLVVASVVATAMLTWYGLVILGWWPRYTLPVAVLVSLGVTQLLAHGMTAPLREMTAAARAMAVGDTPPPVRQTSRDEVGDLARAFSSMAADLRRADDQRRALLADVSHELRTPLTALAVQVENLVDGVRPADHEALEEVLGQVHRLSDLLRDLLDLSRVDGGASAIVRVPTDLAELVRRTARDVGTARGGGTRVQVEVPDRLVADVDPGRIGQVLTNLLDNACRHAPGGLVRVRARETEDGVVLDVSDDGPGIPASLAGTVFDRFVRGPGSTGELPVLREPTTDPSAVTPRTGGTGLGLAIARWAVLLHGGSIQVVPAATGCTIRAVIP